MYEIECDNCNKILLIDMQSTIDAYCDKANYTLPEIDDILDNAVYNYLIYKCESCGTEYKYTYKEWERRFRKIMLKDVMKVRKAIMLAEEINIATLRPGCGVKYCGQCDGIDGKGNCSVDLIKQCTMRKK